MNFKVLDGDICFTNEFVKLNEIRVQFLQEAFDSVPKFMEEVLDRFRSVEQVLKDGESFGYNYLDTYISKAINIIEEFEIDNIEKDIFIKEYYLGNYCTWEKNLEEIKNDNNDTDKLDNVTYVKLNFNSELIKKSFKLQEKNIILEKNKNQNNISDEILNKLVNSMTESIFNINFAVIDILKANNIEGVSAYNDINEINKSNQLIKDLLENRVSKENESDIIQEIIKLNPYNENIYKALLYKYGDKNNQLEELGEFLGYDNIHGYKHKLLDEYYRNLPTNTEEEIKKAKESIVVFANKLSINEYEEYLDELEQLLLDQSSLEELITNKEVDNTIQMATVEADKPIRKSKKQSKQNMVFCIGSIIACIVVVYLVITLYFSNHFLFRTYINGVNVSGKSSKTVENIMAAKANEYSLIIEERNDITEEVSGTDISLKYDFSKGINEVLDNQNPFAWIKSIFEKSENTITDGISYDEVQLKQVIGGLECFNESLVKEPVSAYITYSGDKYEVVKADKGNKVIYDAFYSKMIFSIESLNGILNLDEEKCYEEPKYTEETKAVVDAKKLVDKYASAKITYNTSDNQIVIDSNLTNTWINIDDEFNVTINEDAIREYVNSLGDSYDSIGDTRTFTRWSGEVIKVSTTPGIYYLDRDTTVADIVEAMNNGDKVNKELVFKTPTATDEYVINTFVEVNLTNQTVVYYKNGELITQGNVVTGNVSEGNGTPAGVFKLDWKKKDTVLRGPGYASPVSFWMPFNGGIGLHDASWRSSFGGSIYQTNGSHGCINMPYSVAEAIYNNIEEKTTIICKY